MLPRSVSILGCGWLGFPLGVALRREGVAVRGSTTRREKFSAFQAAGIEPFLIRLEPGLSGEDTRDFFSSEALVITVPFRRDLPDPRFYEQQLRAVRDAARDSAVRTVIFTGSTSIYPEDTGPAAEDSVFEPADERGRVLRDIERSLLEAEEFNAVVIRFAGLCGADRRPGKFFADKKGVPDPDKPVNLIHQDDSVRILMEVLRQDARREIFNACAPQHPSRRDLYTQAALKMGFPPPVFEEKGESGRSKIVSSEKLITRLNYRFLHPDPLRF